MLGNIALVVLACLLLQLAAAVAWAVLAQRAEAHRPLAAHACEYASLAALAMALRLLDDSGPEGLLLNASHLALLGAVLRWQRGLLLFTRQPLADVEGGGLLALSLTALLLARLLPAEQIDGAQAQMACAAVMWVLLRTVLGCWRALAAEFTERWALAVLWPAVAAASLLAALVLNLAFAAAPPPDASSSGFDVALALLLMLASVLVHACLAALTVRRELSALRRLSQRDALTGLLNRAEWTHQLEGHHRWLGRYGESFAVLMIDVDHFKAINDTHGHAAGDAVLIALAQHLTAASRDVDVVCRLGGEEFSMLLPRIDPVSALRTAERLREGLAETEIHWRQQPIRLTVSIGLAMAHDAGESPERLMARADAAMYRAKQSGRNRSVVARESPA